MRFSSRQKMILAKLLQEPQGITVREIAEEIDVSTRTVHRELDELEPALESYRLQLIRKIGIGVRLQGEAAAKEALRQDLEKAAADDLTPHERKIIILCTLLEATEPVKLLSLAHELKVTTATVSHDLDELEEKIKQYGLRLVRRRGYGIELQGSETAKRLAITSLISENLNEYELIAALKDSIHQKAQHRTNSVSERLLGLIEKEKLLVVESALHDLKDDLPYPLADSAFIGLVIHLALAIERVEKGEKIHFHQEYLHQLADTQEYQVAEKLLRRLETLFQMEIPREEIGYITMHLRGAKVRNSYQDHYLSDNVELMSKVKQLIAYCGSKLGVDFEHDQSLRHDLLTHMEPALYRLMQGMRIRNPLLDQIKRNYPDLFALLADAVRQVFPELHVPEEEVGYLAMHFGASLERLHRQHARYDALIVCATGIGSSKILASRIKKEIPEIEGLRNVSLFEVSSVPKSEYDLIISTVQLPFHQDEYILVNPLLTKEDIDQIKAFLKGLARRQSLPAASRNKQAVRTFEQLRSLQIVLTFVLGLLERFAYRRIRPPIAGLEAALDEICGEIEQQGIITDRQAVVKQLLDREKIGGLGIPGTRLALFHCRSDQVQDAFFGVFELPESLRIRSMENEWIDVKTILLLLAPKTMPKEGLEVLSEISSIFIEDEAIRLFSSGEEKRMHAYLAETLRDYTHNRMRVEE
ncbi:BglG family transcription antiterminator [Brevibacillus sp. SYP-B805]|uniref:BglG family transcription antiterminator n=1 Tax=Brevibacillus sp. SYP-B805 TaxID=1578199 RepID=UPI0013EC7501|nr:BglG family transcription antiterminator [Brevibacillus sp. SYP-B805]NGQ95223.1 BglG family transcription antiterminator [Brevibacillus sp. SYP-B805]